MNRNLRFLVYLIIFIGIAIYLACYIDSFRFFNIKKTFLSFKSNVELVDFDKVFNSISPDNGYTKLEIISDQPYLVLQGFEKKLLSNKNTQILKQKALHPSLNLSLFAMGYARDYLLDHHRNRTLGDREMDILENVYLFVYKEIINPFSLNNFSVNDHAISVRLQFISMFLTYTKKNYPEKKALLNALSKDMNICIGFLLDKRFFTWRSNHGIMQLRSLAQLSSIVKDEKFKESILNIIDERLLDIIPYFIGPDGAIYESSSEYWIYIYNQLLKITEMQVVENLQSVVYLRDELRKSRHFIHTVKSNDGFLQGLGDGHSTHIFETLNEVEIPQNRYFRFSNEVVGANWTIDNMNFNLLLISLHTPPNVHKLPEDLAVYFYINHPVFSNTGPFSYDASIERLFFKSEESQSTVTILNPPFQEPISSKITINNNQTNENILSVTGEKNYLDNKSITRLLEIDPTNKIFIRDHTENNDSLTAYYNIHPMIKIKRMSNKQILLQTIDSIELLFISNRDIEIIDGIISENKEEITSIQRLLMTGNPIETTIVFPEVKLKQAMKMVTNNTEENNRIFYAKNLESRYKNLKYTKGVRKFVIYRAIPVFLVLILFVTVIEMFVISAKRKPY